MTKQLSAEEANDILSGLELGDAVAHAQPPYNVPMSAEFEKIDIHAIKIPEDRHRKVLDSKNEHMSLESLAESIRVRGLINPITITRDLTLVAGQRRLIAHLYLAKTLPLFNQISAQYVDQLSPDDLRAIELEENVKRLDHTWQEQVIALADLVAMNNRQRGMNKKETAESIVYDDSTVNHKLRVAAAIRAGNTEVLAAKSPREAGRILTRQQQDGLAKFRDSMRDDNGEPFQIQTSNFLEFAPTYRGPKFDVIHADFPFGVGADKFGQGSGPVHGTYEDSRETNERLNRALLDNLDRIADERCHLIYWFHMTRYPEVLAMLKQYFDRVDPFTLLWHKINGGTIRDQNFDPHQVQETAFLCSRGGRMINKCPANVFPHIIATGVHMNEKPVAVLRHFFEMVIGPYTRVFDPTCGSGSSIRAAMLEGAESALGLEINPDFASRARLALDEAKKEKK